MGISLSGTHPKNLINHFKLVPVLLQKLKVGIGTVLYKIRDLVTCIRKKNKLIYSLRAIILAQGQ
jgi:uncharacterized membrane protein